MYLHIHKNFSSFFFFPHPLSCLHAMLGWKYIWNFFVLFIFREKAKKCYSHNSLKNFIVHHYNFNQNTSKIGIFNEKGPTKYSKDIHEDISFSILLPYLSHCKKKEQKRPSVFGKVYYQTKKKKLSKPDELRPNSSILFTGFLVLIRYFVSMYRLFIFHIHYKKS